MQTSFTIKPPQKNTCLFNLSYWMISKDLLCRHFGWKLELNASNAQDAILCIVWLSSVWEHPIHQHMKCVCGTNLPVDATLHHLNKTPWCLNVRQGLTIKILCSSRNSRLTFPVDFDAEQIKLVRSHFKLYVGSPWCGQWNHIQHRFSVSQCCCCCCCSSLKSFTVCPWQDASITRPGDLKQGRVLIAVSSSDSNGSFHCKTEAALLKAPSRFLRSSPPLLCCFHTKSTGLTRKVERWCCGIVHLWLIHHHLNVCVQIWRGTSGTEQDFNELLYSLTRLEHVFKAYGLRSESGTATSLFSCA